MLFIDDHLDYHTIMDLWRVNEERIHFFVALGKVGQNLLVLRC